MESEYYEYKVGNNILLEAEAFLYLCICWLYAQMFININQRLKC